ncbi:MAG: hypothetical protein B9J98_04735 [Candidatus Terraquivivens tikiterensis]|uniref:DUF2905 domain-containing protein n=1 Tax=Candidatus Terraquivivens tikiterensis TaxID=1980982 RepID=A0A2R7Y3L4_9ARCH|nr:MAG: hypothetical protein B9J98_04735 [Candidatus Terraquivivens tikiterensis]
MIREGSLTSPVVFFGILLIIVGVILVAMPLLLKIVPKLEEVHPFIFWWFRVNGVTVGTSPAIILAAVLIYLMMLLLKR